MNHEFSRWSAVLQFVGRHAAFFVLVLLLAGIAPMVPAAASAADENTPVNADFPHRGVLTPTCLPMRADSKWCYSLTELALNSIEFSPHPVVRLKASWLFLLLVFYGEMSAEVRSNLIHPRVHGSIGVTSGVFMAGNFDDVGITEPWAGLRPALTVSGKRWDLTCGGTLLMFGSSRVRFGGYSTARFTMTDHVMLLSEALIADRPNHRGLAYIAPAVRLQYKRFFVDLGVIAFTEDLSIRQDALSTGASGLLPLVSLSYLF